VAAALAVKAGVQPRLVNIDHLQAALLDQGVYLRPRAAAAAGATAKEQACA
jgi:hypothetical protein